MEGVSLRPAFANQPLARKAPLFFEHDGSRAVRDGRWKLVAKAGGDWELYDIEADRTEINNLAAKQPDKVKAMAARWDEWAVRTNVLPRPGEK
jgi:arylsulfatase